MLRNIQFRTTFVGLASAMIVLLWVGQAASSAAIQTTDVSAKARKPKKEPAAKALEGTRPPEWEAERWLNSPPLQLSELRGKVVLVRWWTAGCPYCRTTAPALREFAERYSSQGLVVVGMYHHKDKEPFDPEVYEQTTKEYGLAFPVAFDPEWKNFRRWIRNANGKPVDTGRTSVTLVLDKKGLVRYVHPGGQYEQGDPDYKKLTSAMEKLLRED